MYVSITDLIPNIITEGCAGRYLGVSVHVEYSQHSFHPSPWEPVITQTLSPDLNHLKLWQKQRFVCCVPRFLRLLDFSHSSKLIKYIFVQVVIL